MVSSMKQHRTLFRADAAALGLRGLLLLLSRP
jgi:hypothetical protein